MMAEKRLLSKAQTTDFESMSELHYPCPNYKKQDSQNLKHLFGGFHVIQFSTWGFPKIKGTILGIPQNKDYNIWGSILGSPDFGNVPLQQG